MLNLRLSGIGHGVLFRKTAFILGMTYSVDFSYLGLFVTVLVFVAMVTGSSVEQERGGGFIEERSVWSHHG